MKNNPFKPNKNNSTTNSQLNDSGHGSGGTVPANGMQGVSGNDTSNKFGLNQTTLSSEPDSQL